MISKSNALEIITVLHLRELELLKRGIRITGALKFHDHQFEPIIDRIMPITISRNPELTRDLIDVMSFPGGKYVGESERIEFWLSEEYFNELEARGAYGARYWSGGKLKMIVIDHPKVNPDDYFFPFLPRRNLFNR